VDREVDRLKVLDAETEGVDKDDETDDDDNVQELDRPHSSPFSPASVRSKLMLSSAAIESG